MAGCQSGIKQASHSSLEWIELHQATGNAKAYHRPGIDLQQNSLSAA